MKIPMRTKAVIIFCTAAVQLSASASQPWAPIHDVTQCRGNPAVVGKCFLLHGAMSLGNGTPGLRIWHVGTKRILGVLPDENAIMPPKIREHLALGVTIYANFEVCPFTVQRAGWMQMVCVQSASHVVIQNLRQDNKGPKIMELPNTYSLAPNNSVKRTQTR